MFLATMPLHQLILCPSNTLTLHTQPHNSSHLLSPSTTSASLPTSNRSSPTAVEIFHPCPALSRPLRSKGSRQTDTYETWTERCTQGGSLPRRKEGGTNSFFTRGSGPKGAERDILSFWALSASSFLLPWCENSINCSLSPLQKLLSVPEVGCRGKSSVCLRQQQGTGEGSQSKRFFSSGLSNIA